MHKPKLIEVALPLDAIKTASAQEKATRHERLSTRHEHLATLHEQPSTLHEDLSTRHERLSTLHEQPSTFHEHPRTLHRWWSRRPLAMCRAVLWASLVDDPSAHPDKFPTEVEQAAERERLFRILERLVVWENSNNPDVLAEAKAEIERYVEGELPAVLDPFAGGGSIPLEAQRLGLKSLASDLNPVAVLINRAMLEIPQSFTDCPPVHTEARCGRNTWSRAEGLAADVKAYGKWMRDEAERRIGHLYPDAVGPKGERLTPVAWIWTRTVKSPDPSWNGHVPLVESWVLRTRASKSRVWVEPVIDREDQAVSYQLRERGWPMIKRTVKKGKGICVATGTNIPMDYIQAEGRAGRMGMDLMAVVAEGRGGRRYCHPRAVDLESAARAAEFAEVGWKPTGRLSPLGKFTGFRVQACGYEEWWQMHSGRQLLALTTFSNLLLEVLVKVCKDADAAGFSNDGVGLQNGGTGAIAYADAVVTYLAFALNKCAEHNSTFCLWDAAREMVGGVFKKQVVGMIWRYAEANPFSSSSRSWISMLNNVCKAVSLLPVNDRAVVCQKDARARVRESSDAMISTDLPYYDKVCYADMSDYFYVWLRHNLAGIWPDECATPLTPKADEMIATPTVEGSKIAAEEQFESKISEFLQVMSAKQNGDFPSTIYYTCRVGTTSWDAFIQSVVDAGLQVTAVWPMRSYHSFPSPFFGFPKSFATLVVLACRPRPKSASLVSRSEFIAALRSELPSAIKLLQSSNIAPVDLPQSAIGPGLKVYSRYAKVVEEDGSTMPVSDALTIINEVLDDVLCGGESELDAESRFALAWYAQHGFEPGPFGDADSIARAKNTAVDAVVRAGVGESSGGMFRLLRRSELDVIWDPAGDSRLTAWKALHHLAARLERSELMAASLLARLGEVGDRAQQDSVRHLAYLLQKTASDNQREEEAHGYNDLILALPVLKAKRHKGEHPELPEHC